MSKEYRWADGTVYKGDAQEVGEYLDELRRRNDGVLTPEQVLQDARRKKSFLHEYFEWDDDEAAVRYRLAQAGQLVRSVHVVYEKSDESDDEKTIRAFVNIERGHGEYRDVVEVLANPQSRDKLLDDALRDLRSFKRRFEAFEAAIGSDIVRELVDALEQAASRVRKRKGGAKTRRRGARP